MSIDFNTNNLMMQDPDIEISEEAKLMTNYIEYKKIHLQQKMNEFFRQGILVTSYITTIDEETGNEQIRFQKWKRLI